MELPVVLEKKKVFAIRDRKKKSFRKISIRITHNEGDTGTILVSTEMEMRSPLTEHGKGRG